MARYGFLSILLLSLLVPAFGPGALADGFDWRRFAAIDGEGWACLGQQLDEAVLAELAVGAVPGDEESRAAAIDAHATCACERRPPSFDGVLFDALARIGVDDDGAAVLEEATASGVAKVGLPEIWFDDLEREFPDLVVTAQGVRFVSLGDFTRPADLAHRMESDPDLGVMVSGREAVLMERCGFLESAWATLLRERAERLLFASGAARSQSGPGAYRDTVAAARRLLGQLPSEAAVAMGRGNAERLYGVPAIGP